jgi:hypothetical protein
MAGAAPGRKKKKGGYRYPPFELPSLRTGERYCSTIAGLVITTNGPPGWFAEAANFTA